MTGETIERARDADEPVPAPLLEIEYFTDPLCCWSWGFEPQLRRLRFGFAGRLAWRLRTPGMIGNWGHFDDPINSVHRPSQMGPLWIQAGTITGMPIDAMLWVEEPPASSWPSCLAVKAAGLQSPGAADLFLRRLREAVMIEGRNIAREGVLLEVAREVQESRPELFDSDRFGKALAGADVRAAFEDDLREGRYRGIARYPCLVMRRSGAPAEALVGWRPYGALLHAIRAYAPELGQERRVERAELYRRYWGGATDREIAEVMNPHVGPAETSTDAPSSGASRDGPNFL